MSCNFWKEYEPGDFVLLDHIKATETLGAVTTDLPAGWVEEQAEVKGGLSGM